MNYHSIQLAEFFNLLKSTALTIVTVSLFLFSQTTLAVLEPTNLAPFGSSLEQSKKTLGTLCKDIKESTLPITFQQVVKSQKQLSCSEFQYFGSARSLKLIFIDDKLDMIHILGLRNSLPDILHKLTNDYDDPTISKRWDVYFEQPRVSLHILKEKLIFVSKRLKKEYETKFKATENQLNLTLSKSQWVEDLIALDKYIRNDHINPFYHNGEDGYLEIFYEAHQYLSNTGNVDKHIINGYFEKLVAYTGDGHSYVVGRTARYSELPFFLDWFGDEIYITSIDKNRKQLLGAKILAFDATKVMEASELIRPFVPNVNESSVKRENVYMLRHPGLLFAAGITHEPDEVQLLLELANGEKVIQHFESNREVSYVTLKEDKDVSLPLYRQKRHKKHWLEHLPKYNSIYIRYRSVVEEEKGDIKRLTQQLKEYLRMYNANKLIVDIRDNNGGNSYLNAPLINAIYSDAQINRKGKLFVLTNRDTFSAAINFAGNMEAKTKALFVGEKVGDSSTFPGESGPQASFQLPNSNIVVNLSFSEWHATFDYDKRDAVSVDIPIIVSINDFLRGKDPVLQAALDFEYIPKAEKYLNKAQRSKWLGRYDYSPDKALKIYGETSQLKMEITELVFSELYPISENEMATDISGVILKKLPNGNISLVQKDKQIRELEMLSRDNLKPLELLVSRQYSLAKEAYINLHKSQPNLLSIRGNSLGILASHMRMRYDDPEFYYQLREVALALYGYPILSWDIDDIAI